MEPPRTRQYPPGARVELSMVPETDNTCHEDTAKGKEAPTMVIGHLVFFAVSFGHKHVERFQFSLNWGWGG